MGLEPMTHGLQCEVSLIYAILKFIREQSKKLLPLRAKLTRVFNPCVGVEPTIPAY